MTLEGPGRRDLAQFMADHVLRYVYRDELLPVMHGYGVADGLGHYGAAPEPCLHYPLVAGVVHILDALHQSRRNMRPLFYGSRHGLLLKGSNLFFKLTSSSLL